MQTETIKPLSWYNYETPKIHILWYGNVQPMGRYKTAEEAKKAIYGICQTEEQVKEFSIYTPDAVINYENFKN
jgi:hypothetical protein